MPLSHDPEAFSSRRPAKHRVIATKPANDAQQLPSHFDIYQERRVRLTSVLFSPSDWRWRLLSPSGEVLAVSQGYSSDAECRTSMEAVRAHAASATTSKPSA
jgi:uncharacterized protein YegP (UPF0339 family)